MTLDRLRWSLVAATLVLVLAQAALAGQYLGEADAGARTAHGVLGNITFVLVVAVAVLAVVRRDPRPVQVLAVVTALLVFSQVGLGYSTRSNPSLVAWHVPLGVAIVATAAYQLALSAPLLRGARPDR